MRVSCTRVWSITAVAPTSLQSQNRVNRVLGYPGTGTAVARSSKFSTRANKSTRVLASNQLELKLVEL